MILVKVLTRSDQLALKHSNASAEDEHGGDDETPKKKRGPGRPKKSVGPKAKASAKSKAIAKAKPEPKVKAKAKAKSSSSKGAEKASAASEVPDLASVSDDSLAAACLAEPEDPPRRAMKTRRGGFKKRGRRMVRKGKASKKVKGDFEPDEAEGSSAHDAEECPLPKRRRSTEEDGDDYVASNPKPKAKARAKAVPKTKAKVFPKAKAKVSPKTKAKAFPKAKVKAFPKAKAKSSAKGGGKGIMMDSPEEPTEDEWVNPFSIAGFNFPKTFAGRFCPKVPNSYGWYVWRHIAKSFIEIVGPNIRDRTRTKKEVRCLQRIISVVFGGCVQL